MSLSKSLQDALNPDRIDVSLGLSGWKMQNLWSRVTQLKSSCRCPSCLSAPTAAVARRSSTAKLGQRTRFGDVFTFFYSSVLATAAVADAGWKDSKRKDLDDSIAKAIAELKATEREQERRIQVFLRTQDELRDGKDEGAQSIEKLPDIFRTPPSTKAQNPPLANLRKSWRNAGSAPIRHNACSRGPDSGRHYGTSTRLREIWPTTEQTPLKLGKEVQPQGKPSGGRGDYDTGVALDQHDGLPLMDGGNTRPVTTMWKRWTSAGADHPPQTTYRQGGAKTQFEIRNNWRKDPGWATKSRIETPSFVIPRAQLPTKISQDAHLRLPTLRYRPSGSGPKGRLEYKLDTMCLKHVPGGFPLWTLPRGQSKIDIWEHARSPRPLDGLETSWLEMSVAKLISRFLIMAIDASKSGPILLKLPRTVPWQLTMRDQHMLKETILQLNNLLMARKPGFNTLSKSTLFPKYSQKLRDTLDTLSKSALFPKYSQKVRDTSDPWKLNQGLLHALPHFTELEELLQQICYQLLASPTPPDVHTYNILIVHLCYQQYYDAAAAVITSVSESDILLNEITTAAILRFFTHTDDAKRFEEYADFFHFRSITAVIKPDHETATTAGSTACKLAHEDKSPSNAGTHKALILGWLRFESLEHALVEYQVMVHSGLLKGRPNLDRRILVAFLQHCVKTDNWELGRAIWEALMERPNNGQRDLLLEQYYWMLQLCVMCRRPSEFRMVLEDGISRGLRSRLGGLRMEDFVHNEKGLRRLVDRVGLLERLRDSRALPYHSEPKFTKPPRSRILNLNDWVRHGLRIINPRRRWRATMAQPVKSISTRPRPAQMSMPDRDERPLQYDQEAVRSADGIGAKSWDADGYGPPITLDQSLLGHGGRDLAADGSYTVDWEYGRLDEFPFCEDDIPRSLPPWL